VLELIELARDEVAAALGERPALAKLTRGVMTRDRAVGGERPQNQVSGNQVW
jgi:hypothetical protein